MSGTQGGNFWPRDSFLSPWQPYLSSVSTSNSASSCLQSHSRALLVLDPPTPKDMLPLPPSHVRNTYSQGEKIPPRMLCCPGLWAGEALGQSVSAPGHRVSQELPFPTGYLSVSSGCPTLTQAAGKKKEEHKIGGGVHGNRAGVCCDNTRTVGEGLGRDQPCCSL